MLKDHGDEFQKRIDEDDVLQGASRQAIEETDSSLNRVGQVMSHLKTVISRLFEVDETGQRKLDHYSRRLTSDDFFFYKSFTAQNITIGKISAVFYYCYSVCKKFVSSILPRASIVAFLSSLGTSLIAYFAKVKFYDWLSSHGGWVSFNNLCIVVV